MTPHRSLFSQHPLAQLAVAFAAGVCAAEYLPAALVISSVSCAVCSVLALVFVIKKKALLAGGLLLVALFFAGAVLAVLEKRSEQSSDVKKLLDDREGEPLKLTGAQTQVDHPTRRLPSSRWAGSSVIFRIASTSDSHFSSRT